MKEVSIQHLTTEELAEKKIKQWPIWEKEKSTFDWHYDCEEHCYIIEGKIIVETKEKKYELQKGDYVIFPKGLSCIWNILESVRKHYLFI